MTDELTYFKGTHRVIAPEKTIENNEDKLKTAGITRIADITDLDRIGLPIYTAMMKLKLLQWRRFPNWESS